MWMAQAFSIEHMYEIACRKVWYENHATFPFPIAGHISFSRFLWPLCCGPRQRLHFTSLSFVTTRCQRSLLVRWTNPTFFTSLTKHQDYRAARLLDSQLVFARSLIWRSLFWSHNQAWAAKNAHFRLDSFVDFVGIYAFRVLCRDDLCHSIHCRVLLSHHSGMSFKAVLSNLSNLKERAGENNPLGWISMHQATTILLSTLRHSAILLALSDLVGLFQQLLGNAQGWECREGLSNLH